MRGLRLYGKNVLENWQFIKDENTTHYKNHRQPAVVRGTPEDDIIEFDLPRFLYFSYHNWWTRVFARGVTQHRLVSGQIVLTSQRGGEMLCAEWSVADNRMRERFTERATGLIVISADIGIHDEQWTMRLYRGDFLLRNNKLERPSGGPCGAPSGGGDPSGGGGVEAS